MANGDELDIQVQELRKLLDWELSLDSSELVSHGWYHGPLERVAAEARLQQDGAFLVRDSSTQPGHYVLSCRQGGHYLHFVINRVVIQPDTVYEHFQYQFEDEAYDTVADLVTSYVGSGKPISLASGARIQTPSNRTSPLSSYTPRGTIVRRVAQPAAFRKPKTPSGPPPKPIGEPQSSYTNGFINKEANHTATLDKLSLVCNRPKTTSEPAETRDDQEQPPAKPARTQQQPLAYHPSGSDSGNGSGDSAQSSDAPIQHPAIPNDNSNAGNNNNTNVNVGMPKSISKNTIRRMDLAHVEENLLKARTIEFVQKSLIDTDTFRTELFAAPENKPLESDTLQTIKILMRASGPMMLAIHLTRVDLKFLMSNQAAVTEVGNPLEKTLGIELCLLAHGDQMRMDIIERAECMKFLVVVTILTCQNDAERADVLNDWIQLAIETKTALGNLFGFSIIMLGLCSKQVKSMENTWNILRQKHTYAAFTFESKLRPSFKNMNDCIDSSPPNTTIPHLLPVVNMLSSTDTETRWDEYGMNTADFGLSVVAAHLEAARRFPEQVSFFERNARVALVVIPAPPDQILLDLFKTEFHIKFLWGARGAMASHYDRHSKLSDIVNTMAERYLAKQQ